MPSYKLNIARIMGCPSPEELADKLAEFGAPKTEEFGVIDYHDCGDHVVGTIIRTTRKAVKQIDPQTHEVWAVPVDNVTEYPFAVWPWNERLEVYVGVKSAIAMVAAFFSRCLALATVTKEIPLDIMTQIDKLNDQRRFHVLSANVSDYAHNSYMIGPISQKFMDTQHGMDFLNQYIAAVTKVSVCYAGTVARVNIRLCSTASFAFSCGEEDAELVKNTLRKLVFN